MATISTINSEGCFEASIRKIVNDNFSALNTEAATASQVTHGTSAPATTPSRVGLIYIKTDTAKVYISTGTASSADWTLLN
jgi:hypothetical protein